MRLIQKIFAPKEIKSLLRILREKKNHFPHHAFNIIENEIEGILLRSPRAFASSFRNKGSNPQQYILAAISNIAGDKVECGRFHVHRGVLSAIGEDFLKIYNACMDELVKISAITPEFALKQKKNLLERIGSAG